MVKRVPPAEHFGPSLELFEVANQECDRCEVEIPAGHATYADTFCVECEHVPLCWPCTERHLAEVADERLADEACRLRRHES